MYPVATNFKVRISVKAGEIPALTDLHWDEFGYNKTDGKLYAKINIDGHDQIVEIGSTAISEAHERVHELASLLDHAAVPIVHWGKLLTIDETGAVNFTNTLDGGEI